MGPPLPASSTLKNVLVIGDSVSIGYTPVVAKLMEGYALVQVKVQHAISCPFIVQYDALISYPACSLGR
jgi:hypothetical protein